MSTTVTTQAEMDAALAAGAETIIIRSPRGVRLTISESCSSMMAVLYAAEGFTAEAAEWAEHVDARRTEHADAVYPLVEQALAELRDTIREMCGESSC